MTQKLSRRDFLRLGTVTAGGVILAACTTTAAPTAAPTAVAPTTAAATAAPTPAAVLAVKDRLKALGVLPGSPDHNKG